MKRRSFFGALASLVMAPFAVKAAKSEPDFVIDWIDPTNFQPQRKRVDIDWFAYWIKRPTGKIRYRWNHGEWQVKEGPLPLQLEDGLALVKHQGHVVITISNEDTDVYFGNPDAWDEVE